ncbi:MAG: hypothetical protein QOH04_2915 [Sphingomonadales bacterium]|nr:hypothetical protein [Sphingomonadales bacterium]
MKKRNFGNCLSIVAAFAWVFPTAIEAQVCPLREPAAGAVSGPLASAHPRVSQTPEMVSFTSKLSRDEDGNPRAYHQGKERAEQRDDGLDHICNGMSVLELSGGELRNKYTRSGTGGSLTDGTPEQRHARALACKRDFITLRNAHFPPCGPGHLCGYFFGIAASDRACGFRRGEHPADDPGCGVPILQTDDAGHTTGFYLTTNTLTRPGASAPLRQSDYADALAVPFIVMPGGQALPTSHQWQPGDIAVVVWNGRVAYGVVGDTGPKAEIGEASRALLQQLGTSDIDEDHPATTLLFPGTAERILRGGWPLTPAGIQEEARRALAAAPGGLPALHSCPGLAAIN